MSGEIAMLQQKQQQKTNLKRRISALREREKSLTDQIKLVRAAMRITEKDLQKVEGELGELRHAMKLIEHD